MEEKDSEFKKDLRGRIERMLIASFYKYGIWDCSIKAHATVKELIAKEYADDYCALSIIDRYFDDVMRNVEHQYFTVNHIASHSYWSYYTQTEKIMVKKFAKDANKSVEEARKIVREVEDKSYKIDTTKFPRSISDSFPELTEQEKPLLNEIYQRTILEIINSNISGNKEAESALKKHLSWLADINLSRNNHPNPKAFIEKYLDRIYDTAYKIITERYTLILPSEE